LVSGRN